MGSSNFQMNATLGQPSPLMNAADPPYSTGFELFPGFWYTVNVDLPVYLCPADFEPDGDVDEDDLTTLAAGFGTTTVPTDTDGDLDMDGVDLFEMAQDYDSTDCMAP